VLRSTRRSSSKAKSSGPSSGTSRLTRRQLLTYGVGAMLTTAAGIRLGRGAGRITFDLQPRRATVLLDGKPAWVVDTASFHGKARLKYTQSLNHVAIALSAAAFPGSNVPAEFTANCRRRGGRWELTLSTHLAGNFSTVDLAEWLVGRVSLRAVTATLASYRLYGRGRLIVPSATTLEWRPDWLHSWSAKEPLEIAHAGVRARSRRIVAGLAQEGSDTAASSTWLKRSVWHLPACSIASRGRSQTIKLGDRRLKLAANARAAVSLETGTTQAGYAAAFTLESEPRATFAIARLGGQDQSGGSTFVQIPLEHMRFVHTRLDAATTIRAEATPRDSWLHVDDASFFVVGSTGAAGFSVQSGTDLTSVSSCHGLVEQIVMTVPGFDSARLKAIDSLVTGTDLVAVANAAKPCLLRLDDYRLRVERMADQLKLDFGFQNLALTRRRGAWLFETIDPLQPSLLRVLFPPQHLQERAYFYQQITEDVPFDANDPKWHTCPASQPHCPDPIKAWKDILDPDYEKLTPGGNDDEYLTGTSAERDTYLTKARLSGGSRLVFAFPKPVLAPPSASLLLNLKMYTPVLSPRAVLPDPNDDAYKGAVLAALAPPGDNETAVEFPTDLFLSADSQGKWMNPVDAPTLQVAPTLPLKPHDLWHTELSGSGLRALWTTDFDPGYFPTVQNVGSDSHHTLPPHLSDPTKRMPMDRRDRVELVALTSVFGLEATAGTANVVQKSASLPVRRCTNKTDDKAVSVFMPQPVTVEHFSLSTLGATARLKGKWDPPSDDNGSKCWDALTVEEWRHIAALGRDIYVRMVYKGYLLPIGIRASLVKVTERQFVRDTHPPIGAGSEGANRIKAVLRQRMFIVIGKPDKAFPGLGQPDAGRAWPFDQVVFTTLVTPDIIDPFTHTGLDPDLTKVLQPGGYAFWPRISTNQLVDFQYNVVQNGIPTSLISSLLFVDNTTVHNPDELAGVLDYYNHKLCVDNDATKSTIVRRIVLVGGSRLTYAPSRKPGDTQFETSQFELSVRRLGAPDKNSQNPNADLQFTAALEAANQPPFYPAIHNANVTIEAIRRLSAQPVNEVTVRFDRGYLHDGFSASANPGEVYLRLEDTNVRLNLAGNTAAAGGVATPNTVVVGLSRKIGLIGGSASAKPSAPPQCPKPPANAQPPARIHGPPRHPRPHVLVASDGDDDANPAIDAIRQGGFDPDAYFSAVLGDAKLLGLIRLVDLIKAASSLIDLDSAPKLLEQYAYAFSAEVITTLQQNLIEDPGVLNQIRTLLQSVNDQVGGLPAVTRLLQPLDALIAETKNLTPPADPTDPAFIASCTRLVLDCKTFLNDISNLASDPSALLPTAFSNFLSVLNGVMQAAKAQDLTKLTATLSAIDVAQEPYLTINKQLAPVRAPFQKAYVQAQAIATELQQQSAAGVTQLLDTLYPVLGTLFQTYCEWVDEGVCFAQAAAAIQHQGADELQTVLKDLSKVPDTAATALDNALAIIDNAIRVYMSPAAVKTNYALALQSVANSFYAGAESLRGRLVALRDQLDALVQKNYTDVASTVSALSAQSQVVITVQALEALVAIANAAIAAANAPAPNPTPPRTLTDDLKLLSASLTQVAVNCSDAATLIGGNSIVLGKALDQVNTQLTTLFGTGGLDVIKGKITDAFAPLKQAADAINAAANDATSSIIQTYLQARDEYIWAASLLATAENCFKLQQCGQFAVFQALQAQLESYLQTIGDPIASNLLTLVTTLQNDAQAPNGGSLLGTNLLSSVTALKAAIDTYDQTSGYWTAKAIAFQQVMTQARSVVDTVHTAIEQGSIASLVNISALVSAALSYLPLPTHLTLSYAWETPLGQWPPDSPTFVPLDDMGLEQGDATLTLDAHIDIDLLAGTAAKSTVSGKVTPFKVYLLNQGDLNFFDVEIETLAFSSSFGKNSQYSVKLGPVNLNGAFSFVDTLATLFSSQSGGDDDDDDGGGDDGDDDDDTDDSGNGFYHHIILSPPAIEVGYRFGFDILPLGEFAIENLRLALGFRLPFDNTPARLSFQVSTLEQPCLIVATPYGGGFFFGMVARAGGGVESMQGAFEFGAMTAFKFGPLSGSGRVAAGFYFSTDPANGTTICGYVVASGEASIAWFAICVELRVSVCSMGGNVEGKADFSFTFRISSFFKLTFRCTAAYRFAGSGSAHSQTSQLSETVRMAQLEHIVGAGAPQCPYPSPTRPPPRCPPNISRAILNRRFEERRRFIGDF
jgi:hypothetical protein